MLNETFCDNIFYCLNLLLLNNFYCSSIEKIYYKHLYDIGKTIQVFLILL